MRDASRLARTTSGSSGTQSPRLHTGSATDACACESAFTGGNLHSNSWLIIATVIVRAAQLSQMAVWLTDTPLSV